MDYIQKKKDRLARLRTLTESPHGIDYDRVRNYFSRTSTRPSQNAYKVRREVFVSKRHLLVEELALTSQLLSRARKILDPWEADLLERYDFTPDSDLIAWVKIERGEDWSVEKLKRQILRIKRKLGAHNERLPAKEKAPKIEKPRFLDMLRDTVDDVKKSILGGIKA